MKTFYISVTKEIFPAVSEELRSAGWELDSNMRPGVEDSILGPATMIAFYNGNKAIRHRDAGKAPSALDQPIHASLSSFALALNILSASK